ncbi:MAG: hypothetical protein IKP07_06280 [Bacilli bacterium]|nr:hypothetical protein [Bacilli bacterium]
MKKQIHILEGIIILLLILIASLLVIRFIYKINHETVDTDYMWNIEFDNLNITEGSTKGNLSLNDNVINLDVSLEKDTEFFEFTLDVTNKGSLNAKIEEVIVEKDADNDILKYNITYLDDVPINRGDIIRSHDKKTIKVRIYYPKQEQKIYEKLNLKLKLNISYVAVY